MAKSSTFDPSHNRLEWVRRFAYRAMLCRHELDTLSAKMIAECEFDSSGDLEPEAAAEIYSTASHATPPRWRFVHH